MVEDQLSEEAIKEIQDFLINQILFNQLGTNEIKGCVYFLKKFV